MDATFPFELDGLRAHMIATALREKAATMQSDAVARQYRGLAAQIEQARREFHARTYGAMAGKYGLPAEPTFSFEVSDD